MTGFVLTIGLIVLPVLALDLVWRAISAVLVFVGHT